MSISLKVIERCAFTIICTCSRLMALPIWFEPNQGQAHPTVQFQSPNTFLRATGAAIHIGGSPIVFRLEHANANAHAEALDRLPGVSNYYLGNDPNITTLSVDKDKERLICLGMTDAQAVRCRKRLEQFLVDLLEPVGRSERRHWGEVYVRSLLLVSRPR